MARWVKKASRLLFPLAAGALLVLTIAAALLIYKEKETLSRLVHSGANPKSTVVYSRWFDLRASDAPSWDRVIEWLVRTGYHSVSGVPAHPSDYAASYPTLTVFTNPFRYPDKDYPAQLLELRFSDRKLNQIEAISGHALLPDWRLEPQQLAEWTSGDKVSRRQVRLSELPPYVPGAILAMEDKRFFQHGAFDSVGIARAFWVDLRSGQLRQGASTISQQLARSIFLDVHRTWRRKALEAALAIYLELRYTKPQLLEMYLNQVYWGQEGSESLLGLEAVSESLFGKPARALTLGESAALAGMLQSPNRYSPRTAPQASQGRKKIVLGLMRGQKIISESQYKAAVAEKVRPLPLKNSNEFAYFLASLARPTGRPNIPFPLLLSQG